MSHYRRSRFGSEKAIMQRLKDLGKEKDFSPEDMQLLQEYRGIDFGADALIDRAAAVEAFNEISSRSKYKNAILTELGIRFPRQGEVYDPRLNADSKEVDAEKKYVDNLINANKDFLHLWDQLRKGKMKERDAKQGAEMRAYMKKIEDVVNASEDNEKIHTSEVLTTIVQAVQEDGWKLAQKDETAMDEMRLADFVRNGIAFLAKNAQGDEVDVRVTGNSIYVHVNDVTGNLSACARKSDNLMKRIEALVQKHNAGDVLGGFVVTTEESGIGTGGEAPLARQEDEENPNRNTTPDAARSGRS